MSNLSKETIDRIEADAIAWSENQYGHDDVNKDYLEGALHEAGKAQPIVDILESSVSIISAYVPIGKRNTEQQILFNLVKEIEKALAKYKEVIK